ncbi:biofilm growth-associated repressor [Ferrovum myxofaciens]|uniref:Biofilm growth-associated repressor n=1 Tax=Ferrovum myxofaciens TaxID=416213 RepID=A0A149W0P7_9PROT|nr:metalloregulator ArsR/SmtB family transcription factor [Ferrovum myxofaciens]KXW58996.1 biofilm growth-associated repressor [Ferrovum myxofaciens]
MDPCEGATLHNFKQMYASADRACNFLKVLANPDRLVLLCRLAEGESCVSELESALDIHQPTLSQQLGILREEGLVATRRDGKHIFYRVISPESIAIIKALQTQFCKPLGTGQD